MTSLKNFYGRLIYCENLEFLIVFFRIADLFIKSKNKQVLQYSVTGAFVFF